ncbi:hypothetical protein [Saccharothrix xinjiangensis]|uniref:Tetratricopeptide repeat protein n=1 Tax=Saccharothrix xinjiangensis TaxID=204798 RepID=A0ABV9XR93_9PSEU
MPRFVGRAEALAALDGASLVEQRRPVRYGFHDLLREYAVERADTEETPGATRAAVHRLLDHYLHTGVEGELLLCPLRDRVAVEPPRPGVTRTGFADRAGAWEWFTAERANLLAALDLAVRQGFDHHAVRLPWAMSSFLGHTGSRHDWERSRLIGLEAARRLGDGAAEVLALRVLGLVHALGGRYRQALDVSVEALGDRSGVADAEDASGRAHQVAGELHVAVECYQRALAPHSEAGDVWPRTTVLRRLGDAYAAAGDQEAAHEAWRAASVILTRIGHPEADRPGPTTPEPTTPEPTAARENAPRPSSPPTGTTAGPPAPSGGSRAVAGWGGAPRDGLPRD